MKKRLLAWFLSFLMVLTLSVPSGVAFAATEEKPEAEVTLSEEENVTVTDGDDEDLDDEDLDDEDLDDEDLDDEDLDDEDLDDEDLDDEDLDDEDLDDEDLDDEDLDDEDLDDEDLDDEDPDDDEDDPDATEDPGTEYEWKIQQILQFWYEMLGAEYDHNNDEVLDEDELAEVKAIDITYFDWDELYGIEDFVNLEELIINHSPDLTTIDLSKNTKLKDVSISASMESIDFSSNTELENLDIDGCFDTLDLTNNTKLTSLRVSTDDFLSLDLTGLTNLESLWISDTDIETIDGLYDTVLEDLMITYCSYDEAIDLSQLQELKSLTSYESNDEFVNFNQSNLESLVLGDYSCDVLDVSNVTTLTELGLFRSSVQKIVFGNQTFGMLDIDDNEDLSEIEGWDNILVTGCLDISNCPLIDELDISRFTALKYLYCFGCNLSELDLTNNTELVYVNCSVNNLEELDISKNAKLYHLECYDNRIESVNISSNPELLTAARNNVITGFVGDGIPVRIYSAGNGGYDYWGNQTLSRSLVIDEDVDLVIEGENELTEEEKALREMFPDMNFRVAVLELYDSDADGLLSEAELDEIAQEKDLYLDGLNISDLKGIEFFTGLTDLNCSNNNLEALDLSALTSLVNLYCENNQLSTLDVSNCTNLCILVCYKNNITSIDISGITGLCKAFDSDPLTQSIGEEEDDFEFLYYSVGCVPVNGGMWFDTNLSVDIGVTITRTLTPEEQALIDMFPDKAFRRWVLETYDFDENSLLDDDEMEAIQNATEVVVNELGIADLTGIEQFVSLAKLNCEHNLLETLDLSENTELAYLVCYDNNLTELDIKANTKLGFLQCYGNQITSIDISENPLLITAALNGKADEWETYLRYDDYEEVDIYIYVDAYFAFDTVYVDQFGDFWTNTLMVDLDVELTGIPSVPRFVGSTIALASDLIYEVYLSIPEECDMTGAYMQFDISDGTSQKVLFEDATVYPDSFAFLCYLNPLQLGDTITVTFYWANGEQSITDTRSGEGYCYSIIDSDFYSQNYPDVQVLAKALLAYSYYLAGSGWTDGHIHQGVVLPDGMTISEDEFVQILGDLEQYKADIDLEGTGIKQIMYSLSLTQSTKIKVYALPEDGVVPSYCDLGTKQFGDDTYYIYQSYEVGPAGLGEEQEIWIPIEHQEEYGTALYIAPLAYAYSFMKQSTDTNKKLAIAAFYKYFTSVVDYNNSLNVDNEEGE